MAAAAVESPSVDSPKQQSNDEKWRAVERLILVQAVYKFGNEDWQLVSKTLREHPLLKRHGNFFSEKACSAKFASILKEDSLNADELPSELEKQRKAVLKVAKRLWDDRMSEVQGLIKKEEERFKTLVIEIDEIRAGKWDEKLLAALDAQQAKRLKLDLEREQSEQISKSADKAKDEPRPAELKTVQDSKIKSIPQQPDEDVEMKDAKSEETTKVDASQSPTDAAAADDEEATEEPEPITEKLLPAADLVEESGEENDEVDQVAGVKVSDEPPRPSTRQRRSSRRNINEDDAAEDEGSTVPPSIQEEREDVEDIEEEQDLEAGEDDAADEPTPKPKRGRPRKSDFKVETPSRRKEDSATATPTRSTRASRNRSPIKEEDADDIEAGEDEEEEEPETQVPLSPPKKSTPAPPKRSISGTASPGVSKKFQQLINIVWRDISNHRFGGVFQQPIREQDASGYYEIVKRPMDLKTIKGKIRDGHITSSSQFHRDILLMLANAHMYNKPGTPVADMTQEMYQHAEEQIRNFMDTESMIETHRGKTADREEAEEEEAEEEESAPRTKRKRLL